jgi:hypothetical protein
LIFLSGVFIEILQCQKHHGIVAMLFANSILEDLPGLGELGFRLRILPENEINAALPVQAIPQAKVLLPKKHASKTLGFPRLRQCLVI